MLDHRILINREYQVQGDWYSPRTRLNEFLSVEKVKYIDQTSSAGDWSGYFVQFLNKKFYLISFSQENNAFAGSGFTLRTGEVVAEYTAMPSEETILEEMELIYL